MKEYLYLSSVWCKRNLVMRNLMLTMFRFYIYLILEKIIFEIILSSTFSSKRKSLVKGKNLKFLFKKYYTNFIR